MLSVILICQNEEHHIRDCLNSVSFADEIVIVDSGSTDTTLSICREFSENIYHQDWLGMNRQKAFALTKAQGDWVLNIDADERITPELAAEIQTILASPLLQESGFYIPRKAHYLGRWLRYGGWTPDMKLRLFRRESGQWIGTDPHDVVAVSGKTGNLHSPLLHYSFENLTDHWNSNNQYATIAAREMCQKKKKSGWFLIIGHSCGAFLKSYILKKGFLEGTRGIIQALMIAAGVMLKYAKAWEIQMIENTKTCSVNRKQTRKKNAHH